ncbi:cupredoxin family protein (plasmid) [Acuticoccus sp. MNP-M23]|uniref:cupredoxin domain-containing protein n=1 Tax=Acuticoccus sp. MNP-M23 TaxID=3072793 RepID=UPI0028154F28|nr:cupredoxin family protein [Acuticoccus sp. MNP-M23]WMS45273.1 cupredoxin family protein [Acuticoccus sp. MNP-M23]
MKLYTAAWLSAALIITPAVALAAGKHSGGHDDGHAASAGSDDHHPEMAIGSPGKASNAARTIQVTMKETDSGAMIFEPASIEVKRGETVRFAITNGGVLEHEFVMDASPEIAEHKDLMQRFPEMIHEDPNAVRLEPGAAGEIVWNFTNTGSFEFACLIPGHYEMGMHGPLNVNES